MAPRQSFTDVFNPIVIESSMSKGITYKLPIMYLLGEVSGHICFSCKGLTGHLKGLYIHEFTIISGQF